MSAIDPHNFPRAGVDQRSSTALPTVVPAPISSDDLYLFNEGTHLQLADVLGAHIETRDGVHGVRFAVWAPGATTVSVISDLNGWSPGLHPLSPNGSSGVWSGFIPEFSQRSIYKYAITSAATGQNLEKSDPLATHAENPPRTGSIVWDLEYEWQDQTWMEQRATHNRRSAPMAIYEMHLGSWMRVPEDGNRSLSYREMAPRLVEYLRSTGFTHVEFLPVMEHPFYGSWGYQTTGYFAPTSRYGTPQDFMSLVDTLHQNDIGVILDWVPSHFPDDPHGLGLFDGTHLYEHADPRQGFHPEWNTWIFNYGRHEVRSFLLSSAVFWLEKYHVDGLRVDAVASMLYLDYSRKPGEWIPNIYGGRENLEAVEFIRRLNVDTYAVQPDVQTIAEESTSWPGVSRPTYLGGLGFGMKWDMGWMHDALGYFQHDPIHRKFHHNQLTFRSLYAWSENFVLPLSHDEVVYGKGSLLGKMPGDGWQQFANLRLLLGFMYAQPGKKLLFMGSEFGQRSEWNHDSSIEWHELEHESHQGVQRWVSALNSVYRTMPALHRHDFDSAGFRWIDANDSENSVLTFMRIDPESGQVVICAFNFTPVPRWHYRVGVPMAGYWRELVNSDAGDYWGSGMGNLGGVQSSPAPFHGLPFSVELVLPPLACVFLAI